MCVCVCQQVCNWVDVPIYGQTGSGASAGDVLGGMIIGGLICKGVTNKDNAGPPRCSYWRNDWLR